MIYFPGCRYTAHAPENSERLTAYLRERFQMEITGCCSVGHGALTDADTAVYVCPTCRAILLESTPQARLLSVWALLDSDGGFPWPDYRGKAITVQDCWRSREDRPMQEAVRSILRKMNFDLLEIGEAYERTEFCGTSLLSARPPRYEKLAPLRFVQNAGDQFIEQPPEVQAARMRAHCAQYETDAVACYCTACLAGLKTGGAGGVHLMDLIMQG